MTTYVVSKRAVLDLRAIWKFGEAQWGADQADMYARRIQRAMDVVGTDPRRGRGCDDIRPGYRQFAVGTHMLFFRPHPAGVEIVRVLHQRMDFARYF